MNLRDDKVNLCTVVITILKMSAACDLVDWRLSCDKGMSSVPLVGAQTQNYFGGAGDINFEAPRETSSNMKCWYWCSPYKFVVKLILPTKFVYLYTGHLLKIVCSVSDKKNIIIADIKIYE